MILDFSQNNFNFIFEITEENTVALKEFSDKSKNSLDKNLKWCSIADIHVSGENQNDHHGAKFTGTSGSVSLKYVSHRYYKNEYGNKLEFNLKDEKMSVVVHYQFYDDISAIRAWTSVTNITNKSLGLEYVSSFVYTGIDEGIPDVSNNIEVFIPHNSWVRELDWKKNTLSELGLDKTTEFSTKRISVSNSGTWSAKEYLPIGALINKKTNLSLMWQIENNGSWHWEISDIADMIYLKLSGPNDRENHWYKELKPNERFQSVKACISVGKSFNEVLSQMTKYRRVVFKNNEPNKKLPVIFNDYMNCLWADPTTAKMIPVIDKAAELGAEYYCMDAGWYADGTWWETVGEWMPCEWRFPNGIKEVFDYIRKKGMIPGIWLEIEVMGINCPIADRFSADCFFMRHGKRVIDHGRYQLDFRNQKVRDFATSVIDRVVSEYGVGYIKMDYNIDGGIGTEVDSDSFGDGLLAHNRAYLEWIGEIQNKYPDLIIENCSSGGMRMDYAMLEKHHVQSVSDQESYKNTAVISALASTAVLPEQAAVWSYPMKDDDDTAVAFNMINSMLQRIHLSGAVTEISESATELIKEGILCYKGIRDDISHSIPFYIGELPQYKDNWIISAYLYNKCIRIAVWRLDSDEEIINIPIGKVVSEKILYPKSTDASVIKTYNGIEVKLNKKYQALLIEVQI